MQLGFLLDLIKNAYNTVGSIFFWLIVVVIALLSLSQLSTMILGSFQMLLESMKEEDSSFVRRFILKPGAALSLASFGIALWTINTVVFINDGFILLTSLNSWIFGILIGAFFMGFLPQFIFSIIVLGLVWFKLGFAYFLILLLLHVAPWLLSSLLVAQSNEEDMNNQYDYFGYPRELLLTGSLCLQFIGWPLYAIFKTHTWGWIVADVLGSTLLLLHLVHTIKYFSKKKIEEENDYEYTNSLFRTYPTYYIALFLLSSLIYSVFSNIGNIKGPDFYCSIATPSWLNLIAIIGFFISIFRVLKNRFFTKNY